MRKKSIIDNRKNRNRKISKNRNRKNFVKSKSKKNRNQNNYKNRNRKIFDFPSPGSNTVHCTAILRGDLNTR